MIHSEVSKVKRSVGNKELNLAVEREICKEEAECNVIGEILIYL